jgi:hypothetical protein
LSIVPAPTNSGEIKPLREHGSKVGVALLLTQRYERHVVLQRYLAGNVRCHGQQLPRRVSGGVNRPTLRFIGLLASVD